MHWKLGNNACDALAQAHSAFTRAYNDEQQVKSDLEDGQILSSEDANEVRQWVGNFEALIPPVREKMQQLGTNC